jgi:hypothetical protein
MARARPIALTSAIGVALAGVVGLGHPGTSRWFPPCPFHAATGLWCPGCGSTRATHELLHANVAGAFSLNPLFVLVVPFAAYVYAAWALRLTTGRELPRPRPSRRWSAIVLAVLVAFAVARNLSPPVVAWMAP